MCMHTTIPQAAMPVMPGRKSRIESFAGANVTYTIEGMMGDKKALQVGGPANVAAGILKRGSGTDVGCVAPTYVSRGAC